MKHLCFFLLFFTCVCKANVSEKFRHYNVIDGLSGSEITSVCENENFLWIGTTDGLNRFDGRNFKVFKKDAENKNTLSENSIEALLFDSRGLLWIGLKTGGVDVYDPRKDIFTPIARFTKGDLPNRVIAIFEDSEYNIWLGSWGNGLYKLTPDKEQELSFHSENHFQNYIVSAITEIPAGYIWIGTYTGYHIYSLKNGNWDDISNSDLVITSFQYTGDKNKLWCSTWGKGLVEFSWEGYHPENIETNFIYNNDIYAIYRLARNSKENVLYLGTWGEGLVKMNNKLPKGTESMRKDAFSSPLIYALYEDKKEKLWIGTYGDGLYCYDSSDKGIIFIPSDGKNKTPTSIGNIVSVGDNSFLAGTLGSGFYFCDLKENKLTHKYYAPPGKGYENNSLALYVDKDIVIAGHDGAGLLYARVQDMHRPEVGFSSFYSPHLEKVTSIFKGLGSRIWLGTKQDGLMSVLYNKETQVLENFTNHQIFGPDEITGFAQQDSQHIWIASHAGLFLFDTEKNRLREENGIVLSEMIYCIEKDRKNDCLWIGSSTGMKRLKLDGNYQPEQPFPIELVPKGTVKDMVLDDDNNLWFIVSGRIFCYVEKENNVREISISALNNRPAISCALTKTDGQSHLLFGSTTDFILINPNIVFSETAAKKIIFTELQIDHRTVSVGDKVYGKVVLDQETEYTSSLHLSYQCKWISFIMAEANNSIWKTKFQYRIDGFSDSWQYLDINTPITFSQLTPGEYVLQVRSYNGNEQVAPCWSMNLSVSYPWWQTGWFYSALVFAGILFIVLAILTIKQYYKKRQQQRLREIEKKKKEELLQEKESFFAGLSHDLATPFSLILAPANDLLRDEKTESSVREKLEIIGKNATFLSDLFNSILELKRAETTNLEIKEKQIEVVSFIGIIKNAFDYLACSRNITLSYHSEMESLQIITDSIKLERIINNLLSNAIKFTPNGGRVTINTTLSEENVFSISIADSGSGIEIRNQEKIFEKFFQETKHGQDQRTKGLGLGLYIVREFVSLLNGDIEIDSSKESGTCITVRFKPVIVEETHSISSASEDKLLDKDNEMTTILIVEDNSELRKYLQNRLSEQFHVISVTEGKQALKVIEEKLPEFVISDIMMPEMDGLTLTEKIKSNPLYADIFVILLTALSSADDERKGYKAGADIYLKKPFDSEALVNQILNIKNTRQYRKQQLLQQLVSPTESEVEPDSKDDFLRRSMKVVEEHLMDADFKIDEFAVEMNLSKTVLHRKFKLLVGQTPNQFIRTVRLRKAAGMLMNTNLTIAEIAYLTGFNQSHYFIKCFKEVYNETPNSYKKKMLS